MIIFSKKETLIIKLNSLIEERAAIERMARNCGNISIWDRDKVISLSKAIGKIETMLKIIEIKE